MKIHSANPAKLSTMSGPSHRWHLMVALILCTGLLSACAAWPVPTRSNHTATDGRLGDCADFYADLDRRIVDAGTVDAAYERIAGFPYLRMNRLLASFSDQLDDPARFAVWVAHLQRLDRTARRIEIANLPSSAHEAMMADQPPDALLERMLACGNLLRDADMADADQRHRLRRTAVAADEYIAPRMAIGLYPLIRPFVARGVHQWHDEARRAFSTTPPVHWSACLYTPMAPPDPAAARRLVRHAQYDALGIPLYSPEDIDILFAAHAPRWEIDTHDDNDRIGAPYWSTDGRIDVDVKRPITFTHLSFTRSTSAVLTQLNYIIWFPARPKTGALDIYGGRLDGLNYRVTLDVKGDPLLLETIHNCGCYYQAYPVPRLPVRENIAYAEPPLILRAPAVEPATHIMVVALAGRTHHVHHLYALPRTVASDAVPYRMQPYDVLRQLPQAGGGRRSMFDRYGLVPGTERLERYLLWPTGVASPGAMRQWGRHAVAFVGKRHFDDPFYLDEMFRVDGLLTTEP